MEKTLRFPFLEWRIENFSCWTEVAHGPTITFTATGEKFENLELSLYSRGKNGDGEVMEITCNGTLFNEEGDVSFVGPDGSLLCSKEFLCHGVLGPKFKEVVSCIEQNEDLHGDHLTLKLRCKEPQERRIHMRTTLKGLYTSLRIALLKPLYGDIVDLAIITYFDSYEAKIKVSYSAVDKILIVKQIGYPPLAASIQCCASVFDRSDTLVAHKKTKHTLTDAFDLEVSDPMPALESDGHCILRMKIINSGYDSHLCDFFRHTSPLENNSKHSSLSVIEDLRCLYQDRELSDFRLKCDTKSFPCHRSILCARSTVFKAMLTSSMNEAASGSVDIEDMDADSLELFLAYLYSGSFKNVPRDNALNLYYAADKYQVPTLKKECADFLCASVGISNVCDILRLGDRHSDDQLTSVACSFILKNFREVSVSKEWQGYMNTNPKLLLKMVSDMAAKGYFDSVS